MRPGFLVRFAAFVICLLTLVSLLFVVIRLSINSRAFFYAEYEKLDHARSMGMTTQDLTDATMQMIHYMEGRAGSIDLDVTVNGARMSMFNDRERAHMVDVRALYQGFCTLSTISLALFAALVALAWRDIAYKKKGKQQALRIPAARAFFTASGAFALLVAATAAWVLADFNSFWTAFHLLFFTNDLWLLDPATSRMINMMPWQLFYDIVLRAILCFVAVWALLLTLAGVVRRSEKRAGL